MSRPRVNESLNYDFIKVTLTENYGRSEGDKEWTRVRCIELDRTYCCIGKFNVAFSLYRVLGVTLYFSEGFLETVTEALQFLGVTMVCFLGQKSNLWSFALQ